MRVKEGGKKGYIRSACLSKVQQRWGEVSRQEVGRRGKQAPLTGG